VDIGGGSTELIIGEGLAAKRLESLYMGSVSFTTEYFGDGAITEKRIKKARTAAQLELEPVVSRFKRSEWEQAFGASGTMRAVSDTLLARGSPNGAIDREGLEWMLQECLRAGSIDKLRLPGLPADRQEIIPGGLAIMVEVFDMLGVDRLRVAEGALREGLLYDLLGRLTDEDARVRSVRAMEARFHVDVPQADRVEATALAFLKTVREDWRLEDPLAEQVLGWAARLHEVGLDISHSHYHHHGAYLLRNADMPGFPREEQQLLAALVGAHRRKLALESLEDLMPPWHTKAECLIVLLRLAVLLHRGRGPRSLPDVGLKARGRSLAVKLTKRWLDDHALTAADLTQEIDYLQAIGFKLRLD
jgi:exopolyphosphatase/guanosine-5'-triphosphate,3'-diphosphate pyrophosphatase